MKNPTILPKTTKWLYQILQHLISLMLNYAWVGYLNAILAQERGNLNELISKSSNARGISQGNVKASRDVYSVDVPGVMKKKNQATSKLFTD